MKISEVPKFLLAKYNLEVTRQTVYNWINVGLHGTKLQTMMTRTNPAARYPNIKILTEAHLDEFLRNSGIQLNVAGSGQAGGGAPGTDTDGESGTALES